MKNGTLLFFTCFTFVSFAQGTTSFIGIGVKMQVEATATPNQIAAKILELIPDGSAINSGLKVGDFIMKVDNRDATNLPLADVVKMIVGEEGTAVTLEVKREQITKTFTIIRKRLANSISHNPMETSDFCAALATIMNDAPYHFNRIIDTLNPIENGYPCKVKVPGAQNVFIRSFFGRSCYIHFGSYSSEDEINAAEENTINKIKTCFPFYYYYPFEDKNTKSIQIGMDLKDGGYSSAVMTLYSYFDNDRQTFQLELQISEGVLKVYLPINSAAAENNFSTAIRKIYDDVNHDFYNIKGTEHEDGDLFNTSYWYDVNFQVPGAAHSYIEEGSITSLSPHQCVAQFFLGEKDLATETYTKFAEIIYQALGSEFVYSYDRPDELVSKVIPPDAENVMIFAVKRERAGESIPVIALINQKQTDGRYLIYLKFYKAIY